MSSNIEAEMARFEEEISNDIENTNEDFKPPPLPPIMPPPMFLPHSLQSGNRTSNRDGPDEKESAKLDSSNNTFTKSSSVVDQSSDTSNTMSSLQESSPVMTNIGSNSQNQSISNAGESNARFCPLNPQIFDPRSVNPALSGPIGPMPISSRVMRPIGPGPMGPGMIRPGPGPGSIRLGSGPLGPGPMSGPLPPNILGPNGPPRPILSGPVRPPFDNGMVGPMPPPMPSFFPPPVLPDFTGQKQQTIYAAAPKITKKLDVKKKDSKSKAVVKTKKTEKEKSKKNEKDKKEVKAALIATNTSSDDRLSEIGPEAGPHVGPQPVPMQHHTFASQPPLYGLSPLAGNPQMAKAAAQAPKKKKIIRTAAGQKWDDPSLLEWDPNDYRIFCGDLGNEVTDDTLARIFSRYSSFQKARVVREKNSKKSKGYGFVSFKDPNDFIRAMREINGKYVGNRPIKLRKSNWKDRNLEVVRKKVKEKKKLGYKV